MCSIENDCYVEILNSYSAWLGLSNARLHKEILLSNLPGSVLQVCVGRWLKVNIVIALSTGTCAQHKLLLLKSNGRRVQTARI